LAEYRDAYPQIRATGADLAAISVDKPAQSQRLRRELQLPFTLLCDTERRVVREWNVYNPREHGGIARPSVFIIEPDLRVRFSSVDRVATRLMPADILGVLKDSGAPAPRKHTFMPRFGDLARATRNMVTPG
jgi:peroxiredoxin